MSDQEDDLLLSLQSSLRNALATFGPASPQYLGIKYMVDEHVAKAALRKLNFGDKEVEGSGRVMNLALRPKGGGS